MALLRQTWEEAIREVHEALGAAGFDDVRPAHRMVLRDILTGGLRPTELADRLGVSKQAANDVLRELEGGGYITLVPDPGDGRAKRIVATERGDALVHAATRATRGIAERWATQVGPERFAAFEDVLRALAAGDATPPPASGNRRRALR